MRTVHKYPVSLSDIFTLELPRGAEVLTAQAQDGDMFLWALVDTNAPTEEVVFRLANTGDCISETSELKYVNTFQLRGRGLIYHLFEIVIPRLEGECNHTLAPNLPREAQCARCGMRFGG
jgi:hypothetical protein